MNDTLFGDSLFDNTHPVEERDLVVPMLLIMAQADRKNHGPVSTFQFTTVLKNLFVMSEEDDKIVKRDNVTRFQRTLQNVISHDLLTANKYATRKDNGWVITPKGRAHLLNYLLEPKEPLPGNEMRVIDGGPRVLETTIAFYMLVRLSELQKDNTIPVTTAQLRRDIKSSLPLSVEDLAPLKNRPDTKIDQVVRNIVSHNTLTKEGYCTRSKKGLVITQKGKVKVLNNLLEVFPAPDFGFLLSQESQFRISVNTRRQEVAVEAAAARKKKQVP